MVAVSVGIPFFNAELTVRRALNSVLQQYSTCPFEVILVNDGSTDLSPAIGIEYQIRYPDIVRYFSQPHSGVSASRNRIVELAQGDFICWLDADDVYRPGALARLSRAIEAESHGVQNDMTMVMGSYFKNGEFIEISGHLDNLLKHLLEGTLPAYLWTTIAPRSLYKEVGPFDPTLGRCEDLDFMLRVLLSGRSIRGAGGEGLVDYNFTLRGRSGKAAEEAMEMLLVRYHDQYRSMTEMNKFKAARLWQIADYYRVNAEADQMWRCRCRAVAYDFDTYFQKLILEIVADGKKGQGKAGPQGQASLP